MGVWSMGLLLIRGKPQANRILGVIKKAIENETEDDHRVSGEYHCASTSAVLHPLPEEHRTRNKAERGQQGVAWYGMSASEKTPYHNFLAGKEVIEEDMNGMEKTNGG